MINRLRRIAPVLLQRGQVIEIIRLHRPGGQQIDLDYGFFFGTTRAAFIARHGRHDAPQLVGQLLLREALLAAPLGKFHEHAPGSPNLEYPFWIDKTCPLWQYANMANGQVGYIRLVADNTKAPNRIRELREAKGISQADLARAINVTAPALQKVEVGARKMDQLWMRRIAMVLGCAPADLLPLEDNPWALSDEEKALIASMRQASQRERDQLARVADVMLEYKVPPRDAA